MALGQPQLFHLTQNELFSFTEDNLLHFIFNLGEVWKKSYFKTERLKYVIK